MIKRRLGFLFFLLLSVGSVSLSWSDDATVSPAPSGEWNAVDFGLTPGENADNTQAIQTALDAAGKAGGGIVRLPAGRFTVKGTLSIPEGVTLSGVFGIPPTIFNAKTPVAGTILLAYAGRGEPDSAPFIRLAGSNGVLKGVSIIYPEWDQNQIPPIPYPPCIAAENAENIGVIDCCLLNPYEGIRFVRAARHLVRNVTGYPIKRGIFVDECYDIGHIENIHFWPFGVIYKPDDPYCQWINFNGTAFEFARTDWQYVSNTFCFGYGVGYKFSEYASGGANGNFLGIGADSCRRAVLVDQAQEPGLLIVNGEFVGRWSSEDSVCLEINENCEGKVCLTNTSFWGPVQTCVLMKSPNGQLTVNACHFVNWDEVHSAHFKQNAPAIEITAGRGIIQGSTFEKGGTHVRFEKAVASLIMIGNQAPGGFNVEGPMSPRIQTAANEPNPIDFTPEGREWLKFDFGARGEDNYLRGWSHAETRNPTDPPLTFRWSGKDSQIVLPLLPSQTYDLTLELEIPPLALEGEPEVGVYYQGKKVADFQMGFNRLNFRIDSANEDKSVLELRCRGWRPSDNDPQSRDTRELGLQGLSLEAKMVGTKAERPFNVNHPE